MLTQRLVFSTIKTSQLCLQFVSFSKRVKSLQKPIVFEFSQQPNSQKSKNQSKTITYEPIRPLKKQLTALYVQKNFLNRGEVRKPVPFWPYLSPFYAMLINNYLTEWSLTNGAITSVLLLAGLLLHEPPRWSRQRMIMKLQCTQDMKKFYMTVPFSWEIQTLRKRYPRNYDGFQESTVFTEEDYKYKEWEPTEEEKKTLSEEELNQKKMQLEQKLVGKILLQKEKERILNRFELDASKTMFKLTNTQMDTIKDRDVLHPQTELKGAEMFDIPYKYLIVRTEFIQRKNQKPLHYWIDLEENGDLKYQDYLAALGANYKISLAVQSKK